MRKFSNVISPLKVLCKINIELTFENFHRVAAGSFCGKSLKVVLILDSIFGRKIIFRRGAAGSFCGKFSESQLYTGGKDP